MIVIVFGGVRNKGSNKALFCRVLQGNSIKQAKSRSLRLAGKYKTLLEFRGCEAFVLSEGNTNDQSF